MLDTNYDHANLYKDYHIVKCKSCYRKWHVSELKDSNCPGCGGAVSKPSSTGHWRDNKTEQLVWCNPGSISFRKEEIIWLLPILYDLRNGWYVPEPKGGYVDLPISQRRIRATAGAYFTRIVELAAEIDWRLARVYRGNIENPDRFDCELLEKHYCKEDTVESLARLTRFSMEEVENRIQRVLNYISSNRDDETRKGRRRTRSYQEFVSHRKDATHR